MSCQFDMKDMNISGMDIIARDFMHTLLGDVIGQGAFRRVYECTINPEIVIKIETDGYYHHNVHENEVWERVEWTSHAKWFAPVINISPCGKVLVQKRTEPIPKNKLPEKIPNYFTDTKPDNWGLFDGRPVCHDYSINLLMEKGMSNRLVKAKWLSFT